jgi:hypothetical protein
MIQYDGHIDFSWSFEELRALARRAGETYNLAGSSVLFLVNVSDWYSDQNRTGWATTTIYDKRVKLSLIGSPVRSFKPLSEFAVQASFPFHCIPLFFVFAFPRFLVAALHAPTKVL